MFYNRFIPWTAASSVSGATILSATRGLISNVPPLNPNRDSIAPRLFIFRRPHLHPTQNPPRGAPTFSRLVSYPGIVNPVSRHWKRSPPAISRSIRFFTFERQLFEGFVDGLGGSPGYYIDDMCDIPVGKHRTADASPRP